MSDRVVDTRDRASISALDWAILSVAAALIGLHMLVPLDRGFPPLLILGRPLNTAIAASLIAFAAVLLHSRGRAVDFFREPYCLFQIGYGVLLVASAIRAPAPLAALHWSLLYFCTFTVNYVTLRYITERHGTRYLSIAVVVFGIAAAAVSIVQAVWGIPVPIYDAWFENYFRRPPENYALANVRAAGTMSNPILYCVLMLLAVLFAFDRRNLVIRSVSLFVLLFAAGLSGSRTALPLVLVIVVGCLMVWRWRAIRALPAAAAVAALLVWSIGWMSAAGDASRAAFLADRSGLTLARPAPAESPAPPASVTAGPGSGPARVDVPPPPAPKSEAVTGGELGITLRRDALLNGLREMIYEWSPAMWIFGRGTFSSAAVGQRLQPWYNTVDNTFLTVLYERGLLGLTFFVGAFGVFLYRTRARAFETIHWYAPVMLALAGFSFCWDAYSAFNLLVVASMVVVMHGMPSRDRAATGV